MRSCLAFGLLAVITVIGCNRGNRSNDTVKVTPETSPESAPLVEATPPPGPPPPLRFTACINGLPTDGMWKCDPVFADVNQDGNLDLGAIPRKGHGARVWLGDGQGNWTPAFDGLEKGRTSCGGGVRFHDVNHDGLLDLCVADHCQGAYVYLGDGKGHWRETAGPYYPTDLNPDDSGLSEKVGAEAIDVGDLDGDSHPDLLVASSDDSGIRVFFGDGSGATFTMRACGLDHAGWANRVLLHDVNQDGALDVLAAKGLGPRVWLNDGQGYFTPAWEGLPEPIVGGLYTGIAVADINNDGLDDIATANWIDGPEGYLQQPGGTWKKLPDIFPDMVGGSEGIDLGDIDQDGTIDLVVSGRIKLEPGIVRGVSVMLGDGTGAFTDISPESGIIQRGLLATPGVKLADINNDGLLDVAATSGLIVETSRRGPRKPLLDARLIVWCTAFNDVSDSE